MNQETSMTHPIARRVLASAALPLCLGIGAGPCRADNAVPLKEAKLIIEHNATDLDTGFQGFIDSESWSEITVAGPDGEVLRFEGLGRLRDLGLTELFFETVEPENGDVPIETMLALLPEGEYVFTGVGMESGEATGTTIGAAHFSHAIPAGPVLEQPADGATVDTEDMVVRWSPVTKTIGGEDIAIVAYQLIIERDIDPHPIMIGKFGLSVHLPPDVSSFEVPEDFLEAGTAYKWEVLAIADNGNQTLSSGAFSTR
jgi:hypothetical protein